MIIPGSQIISTNQEEVGPGDRWIIPVALFAKTANNNEIPTASRSSKKNPVEKINDLSFSNSASFRYLTVAESIPNVTIAESKIPVGKSKFQSATSSLLRLSTIGFIVSNWTMLYNMFPKP